MNLLIFILFAIVISCNETCFTYCFKKEYTTLWNTTTRTKTHTRTVTVSTDLVEPFSILSNHIFGLHEAPSSSKLTLAPSSSDLEFSNEECSTSTPTL